MMKIQKVASIGLVALSFLMLGACSKKSAGPLEKIEQKKQVVIATAAVDPYPPFEFQTTINGKNQLRGSDIDLAKAIGKKLGVKVKIESMSFDNVLTWVKLGKADMAIAALSVTKARQKTFDFSDIYYKDGNALVVKKEDLNKYTSVKALAGKEIAAPKGTLQESAMIANFPKAVAIGLPTSSTALNEVQTGKSAAAVVDEVVAEQAVANNSKLAIGKIKLADNGEATGFGIAMKKNSGDLKTKVNQIIKELKADGSLKEEFDSNLQLAKSLTK